MLTLTVISSIQTRGETNSTKQTMNSKSDTCLMFSVKLKGDMTSGMAGISQEAFFLVNKPFLKLSVNFTFLYQIQLSPTNTQ